MKVKVKTKIILLYIFKVEDFAASLILLEHCNPVINELMEDLELQKYANLQLIWIERVLLLHKNNLILFFMIGPKYMQYIVMEHNILEADRTLFHIKIKNYILEVQIMFFNKLNICKINMIFLIKIKLL